jgi:hypothetical protein
MRRHLEYHTARAVPQLLRLIALAGRPLNEHVDVALDAHRAFLPQRIAGLLNNDALPLRVGHPAVIA